MVIKLTELPNEIIYQILLCLPPSSVPKVQQVSRQFNGLSQPILWRHHCRTQFTYWGLEHGVQEKFREAVAKVDWRKTFSERHNVDRMINREIDSILSSQTDRTEKIEKIVACGYDAKDTLLRHIRVDDEVEDVLARRYHSDAVLGNLHRRMAIREWAKLKDGERVPLERVLTAFDMFVLHGRKGDFDEVSALLDQIAEQVQARNPEFMNQSLRRKAIALSEYLQKNNLVGVNGDSRYRDLQNNFVGIALQDEKHPSLPLISVAIFCCIATRLGLDAHPCGFPFHVLAIIKPLPGYTLDGEAAHPGEASPPMYMDPFRSGEETDVENLKAQLRSLGVPPSRHLDLLDASSTEEIVRRCATNIITSVQELPRQNGAGPMSTVPSFPEMDGALYAALWALILLPEGHPGAASLQRTRYLRFIVEKMETQFLMDVRLIEEHILPSITDPGQREGLVDRIRVVRTYDHMPKQMKERNQHAEKKVRYKVGQVFQHKRYHYQAVIIGWDVECAAGDAWMAHMGVHSLARGQHQSFYHVLVEDQSVRYVAEENIVIKPQEVDSKLMALAGNYFKRYDCTTGNFVSNLKDEYPDD